MRLIDQERAKELLEKYDVEIPKTYLLKNREEIEKVAPGLPYPVVMKVDSPDIVHKSDEGMVVVGITDKEMLLREFARIEKKLNEKFSDAKIENFMIQEMVSGHECIVGMKQDAQFGPVIMFGLGGIFVEILKDVSFRIAPFDEKEARAMVEEIKSYKILEGARGQEPANIDSIVDMLLKISRLSVDNPDIKEIDFNPIMVDSKRAVAVDARMLKGDEN